MTDIQNDATTGATSRGHVFVVHGRMESVVHDFAIIPTSDSFGIRNYWKPVVGPHPRALRPHGWPDRGFGQARDGRKVWFVSVGGARSAGSQVLLDRAAAAIAEMTAERHVAHNRVKPLVAVPVLGISGGGLGGHRGEVLAKQLAAMELASRKHDVDIAVVTPDASVYAAAQHVRRGRGSWPMSDEALNKAMALGESARNGELALFLGAGVSIPAGLPTWPELLESLARRGGMRLDGGFDQLSPLDQAQLVANKLPTLGGEVATIITMRKRPSLGHVLLGSLNCREAVTTNYDRLYEKAVGMQRGQDDLATILPWQAPRAGQPWILKMHGDVKRPRSIVLTRDQFVGYDRTTKPAGALLQSLLMTRHVMFVGASLNDDNVVRLAYEVDSFRKEHNLRGKVGTLLDVTQDRVRRELWRKQLDWIAMPGDSLPDRARALEVFLDAVAAHASRDSSWLLDERFSGLLDDEQTDLARRARRLHDDLAAAGGTWIFLAKELSAFGAAAGRGQGGGEIG